MLMGDGPRNLMMCLATLMLLSCGDDNKASDAEDSMTPVTIMDMGTDAAPPRVDAMRAPVDSGTPDARVVDVGVIDAAPPAMDSAPIDVEVARCEEPLGGIPWTNMIVESTPNFEADLAAVDLSNLPAEVDISAMNGLFRGIIAYALDIAPEQLGGNLRTADLLAGNPLSRSVAASLALGLNSAGGIDFTFLRRGLHRYYHCGRDFPRTLDGFRQTIYDFGAGQSQDVDSVAKCGTRRLIVNEAAGVYVAETLIEGDVRETEILLSGRRNDGNLDFLIYNADGQLSDRSSFPTVGMGPHVMAASPYVCTTCHMNRDRTPDTFGYDILFPEVGPCAR